MTIEAWYMDDNQEDPWLPHHRNPKEFVSMDQLAEIGVLCWKLNHHIYETDEELKKIREERGYNYMDVITASPKLVPTYWEDQKKFFLEHLHAEEEIRYVLEGSGYWDVRDKNERWIRLWGKAGDLLVLPAGIYHRGVLDSDHYIKLMRLFAGVPVWTPFNRSEEEHPARGEYIKSFGDKVGLGVASAAN